MIESCLHTFFFEEDATFRYDDGDIPVDVALAFVVEERDRNVGVADRGVQWNAKNARSWSCDFCVRSSLCSSRLRTIMIQAVEVAD